MAVFAVVATVVGNTLSYWRRERPWPAVKPILAVCALGGFVWFIATVSRTATPGDISTVESPLAVLFAWVLCTHAFDVPGPARRGLLAGRVGRPDGGGRGPVGRPRPRRLRRGLGACSASGGWWPCGSRCPAPAGSRGSPWAAAGWRCGAGRAAGGRAAGPEGVHVADLPLVVGRLVAGRHARTTSPTAPPSLPAHAASPSGPTRVGGFLGFAKSLDTGDRGRPSATRWSCGCGPAVPASGSGRPTTPGTARAGWNRRRPRARAVVKLETGSPFEHPADPRTSRRSSRLGDTDVQTFYLAQSGPNLVFHADNAERVYIQSRALYLTGDGTIVSSTSMGSGTIYTVVSADNDGHARAAARRPPCRWRRATPRRPTAQPGPAGPLPPAPPPLPPGGRPGPPITAGIGAAGRRRPPHLRQGRGHRGVDGRPHPVHHRHPAAAPGRRRGDQLPLRHPAGLLRADLHRHRGHAAHPSASRPGRRWATCPAPTIRSPTSTTSRPRTPTPGCRCGSPATAGRASTRRPTSPWPTRPRARCWPAAPAARSPSSRGSPSASSSAVVVTVVEIRRRRRRRPPTWAHQIAADLERGGARVGRAGGGSTRRSRPTGGGWPRATGASAPALIARQPSWWSATPTAASSRRPTRSPPRWPSPAATGQAAPARATAVGPGSRPRASASASSNEAPAASRGR